MFRLSRIFSYKTIASNYLNQSRSLYSLNSLGIDGYIEKQEKVKQYFTNDGADKFREKMNSLLENNQSMVFTEDLKHMLHLANNNDVDLVLLEKMLRLFTKQNKETRFGNFIFGPVVMRFFYHINNADVALKLFKDPEFEGFFDQLISYQILADMLYEQRRYQDIIDVYQIIKSKQIQDGMYPKYVLILVFAACYKENTPESFKFATDLWAEINTVGHVPLRRSITFAAGLALKQNAPHVALEIIAAAKTQQYVTIRNIKALAFTNLGRVDDAIPILKSVLQTNDVRMTKHTFTKEVLDCVKEAVNKSEDGELKQNFNRLEKALIENGYVTNTTLDQLLTSEIDTTSQNEFRKDRSVLAASYRTNSNERYQTPGYKRQQYSRKPGLADYD